ncbi:uncharacterized protein LOC121180560 [Toxotes jaculatrix]|uniref:uncharacterized protein LOC121180560 n=1 Tax=Toxotes jaculatrix TaxID=941984 RepID=UPI001B3AE734|nr:uncharacterized protein LOC121180560 [Toxotes jaculatrix]
MMLFPKKMELNRRPCNWMCLIPLSLMGIISTALPLSESKTFSNLDCTNDLENHMCCYFEAQNCSLYNLTLQSNDGHGMKHCTPNQCDSGQCCCSVQMTLVLGESFTAVVLKEGQRMESKIINIRESIKPKTPTIISVEDVNGSFRVSWKTNTMGVFGDDLKVNVTYHKKGDTEMVSEFVKPATINGLKFHEISRHNLEPSTRYVVSVKSYTDRSGKFSDSSNEWEFTTRKKEAASPHIWHLVVIVSLSFAAVIITSAAFGCYNSFKAKCLDTVAICPNPKLFDMRPGEEQILKLPEISLSSISTDSAVLNNTKPWSAGSLTDTNTGSPQQSSGISAGSSSHTHTNTKPVDIKAGVQDALGKAFPLLRPVTSVTTNQLRESNEASGLFSAPYNPSSNNDPGSTDFENMSYFIRIPSYPHQKMTDSSEVQTQADMICHGDSAIQILGDFLMLRTPV